MNFWKIYESGGTEAVKRIKVIMSFVLVLAFTFSLFYQGGYAAVRAASEDAPAKPSITIKSAKDDTAVKITISETEGADGYRIYMKSPSDAKYKKIKTLKKDGTEARSYTIKNLEPGDYSFRVKAYSKESGNTVWSSYSKGKKIALEPDDAKKDEDKKDESKTEGPLITIKDSEGRLTARTRERIQEIAEKTYPELWSYFNSGDPHPVTIEIIRIESNPAYSDYNGVWVDYEYANNNYGDLDFVTHELCHVAQHYTADVPTWLVEGIADFGRNKFGLYNSQSGWSLNAPNQYDSYTDSYGTTAAFLNWIDTSVLKNFVKKLDSIIKEGKYSANTFEALTGSDIDELWEKYLAAYGIKMEKVDLTLPEVTPIPAGTDISKYLTIVDKSGSLSKATRKNLEKVFNTAYGKICEEFNYGVLVPVTLTIDPNEDGVAYTTNGGQIVLGADYIRENPEDYDCFTHELVHVAQSYDCGAPGWFVEGMADLGRDMFGLNNKNVSWNLPLLLKSESEALDGYRTSAAFLKWITENYDKDAVKKINKACKECKYKDSLWKDITGKSLAALVSECVGESDFKFAMEPGEYAGKLIFFKGDEKVPLSAYYGKPTIMIFGDWQEDISGLDTALDYVDEFGDSINAVVVCTGRSANDPEAVGQLLSKYSAKDRKLVDIIYDRAEMQWAFSHDEGNGYYVFGTPGYAVLDKSGNLAFNQKTGGIFFPEKSYEEIDNNGESYARKTMRRLIRGN